MATKIYVSQIDTANTTGGQSPTGSLLVIGSNGPYWSNASLESITGINLAEIVGYTGSVGFKGSAGDVGYLGSTGYTGSTGSDGPVGTTGYTGSIGSTGYLGSVGYTGSVGNTGYRGSEGYKGSEGYRGSEGFRGSVGFQGSIGTTGYRGSAGDLGSTVPFAFTSLTDVSPQNYTGKANHFIRVNSTANGLVFDSNTYVTNSFGTSVNFSGNTVIAPSFKSYSETVKAKGSINASVANTVTIEFNDGNVQTVTLNAASIAVVLSTAGLSSNKLHTLTLFVKQDATGGRTIDWSNQTIYWPRGEGIYSPEGPTLTANANYTDVVSLSTLNAGSSWYGVLAAKGFPTT